MLHHNNSNISASKEQDTFTIDPLEWNGKNSYNRAPPNGRQSMNEQVKYLLYFMWFCVQKLYKRSASSMISSMKEGALRPKSFSSECGNFWLARKWQTSISFSIKERQMKLFVLLHYLRYNLNMIVSKLLFCSESLLINLFFARLQKFLKNNFSMMDRFVIFLNFWEGIQKKELKK